MVFLFGIIYDICKEINCHENFYTSSFANRSVLIINVADESVPKYFEYPLKFNEKPRDVLCRI